jgi:DNA-directed RNA polymerase subunit RPC12/RpoP
MSNIRKKFHESQEYYYSDFQEDIRKNIVQRWEIEARFCQQRDIMVYCCTDCGNSMCASRPLEDSHRPTPCCPECSERMEVTGDDVIFGSVSWKDVKATP